MRRPSARRCRTLRSMLLTCRESRIRVGLLLAVAELSLLLCSGVADAGGGPENVALVVNAESWASLAVANEYIRLRRIPATNVIYLDYLPDFERTDIDTFRFRILVPVLDALERRGLAAQIDYVVYSSDIPYTLDVQADVGKRKLPPVITPAASINGATYLCELVHARDLEYLSLNVNRYLRRPLLPQPSGPPPRPADRERLEQAVSLLVARDWTGAGEILAQLEVRYPHVPSIHYQLARCRAHQHHPERAIAALHKALDAGWRSCQRVETIDDFRPLRGRQDFQRLLERTRSATFDVQPSHGFRHAYRWNADGEIVADRGHRYLLSTVLAITSGRGNSVSEALASLRRSAAADGSQPHGTIYYMMNDDVRSVVRDAAFPSAITKLTELGVSAELLRGKIPTNKPDVCGLMTGAASLGWTSSGSTIQQGAICEHLTSHGGNLRENGSQTPLTEFIRYGAAGASGTVAEPYSVQAKFPFAFVHVHYARGCSLAEAFYQSVAGPYQLLIVGDPLCQPWAVVPRIGVEGPEPGATIRGRVSLRPRLKGNDAVRVERYELYCDGRRVALIPPGGAFDIDTTAIADGYHELRVVAVAAGPIETQGRIILPLRVGNHGHLLRLSVTGNLETRLDDRVHLAAALPGAREINIVHNHRVLAKIAGESGSVAIEARRLGLGPVRLHAVGTLSEPAGARVASRPVELSILPPEPLPALRLDAVERLAPGMELKLGQNHPALIHETRSSDWLTRAGAAPGETFELVGYFRVLRDDVYQFQIRSNSDAQIQIDDSMLETPVDDRWNLIPVALQAGLHRMCVRGSVRVKPRVELRFGGPGALSVDGVRFQHIAPARHP
nr:conserved hypothetical protein [uncultured bacterium]